MREINIATVITAKRKEKGITQDELAKYIGVSKASVSKWETAQSYPDITFLPQLAAFFNISIDELIGYLPQMTKENIKKTYHRLASEFSRKPFDEVLLECRSIIKEYYSCFPLLLQMVVLYTNHYMLAKEKEIQEEVLRETIRLCERIKKESDDVWIAKQANSLEAVCHMLLQEPAAVLELLDGTIKPMIGGETILANAYQMTGNIQKAKSVLQICIYQHLIGLIDVASSYLFMFIGEPEKFEQTLMRFMDICKVFELDTLHLNAAGKLYYSAAQIYVTQNNPEKALEMLDKYSRIWKSSLFPYKLCGDDFFDGLDEWFDEFDLGPKFFRDEKVIKESIIQSVIANPAFSVLGEEPKYQSIVNRLKSRLGGD